MVTRATGTELKLACKKAATWGTAVTCTTSDAILVQPSDIKKSRNSLVDNSLGLFWPTDADLAEIKAEGKIKAFLRYSGLDLLIAMAMGGSATTAGSDASAHNCTTAATTTSATKAGAGLVASAEIGNYYVITSDSGNPTNVGQVRKITSNDTTTVFWSGAIPFATSATTQGKITRSINSHAYTLANNVDGQFVTAAVYNGVSVLEHPSAKVAGFTIRGAVGGVAEIEFDLIANDRISTSTTNTAGTMTSATVRETANRALYSQCVMRMNVQSAGALASPTDLIYPSSWELTFKRKMAGQYGAGGSFSVIDEPANDGVPEVTLKLEFPRYTADTYFQAMDANTAQKMDIVFTGATLGASARTITIELPNLKYKAADLPMSEGIMKHPLEFVALGCATAPTGMAGLTVPFRITMVNNFGGDPLQTGN